MAYTPQEWRNDDPATPLSAARLNHIEQGIAGVEHPDPAWADVTGKPSTFPPATHSHATSEVTGLDAALAGKAASSHTHTVANVTGLQAALDGKQAAGSYAAATHTHTTADVTGLDTALAGKAPTSHTHAIANVTGLQAALDGKQASGSYATAAALADLVARVEALEAAGA